MFELDYILLKDLEELAIAIDHATHPDLSLFEAMKCVESANRQIAALSSQASVMGANA